ncbi:class 1b ribonucleoside-diphosphate reductase subunit alpha [Vagococcus fluvialis]|uniref:class 1b ribonucleoside-diphosphate reductase subunit alpha n=1 Tax=Vagococcus fluvialis TaxID=2738 RepID=UPI001D0A7E93|nr:class 1b ribonucleoside-diphosphate reductase subunit alpha [Vagococcus fluvialis]UDM72707.1 class 1b ribonucleoside-diphosphate reductase subunit alpha [Vagococcus fluvialis]UDM78430.1 class 1b ribonucleoside-diphosphate reductase subunit alpha [Vagococcus fluvialis]UDM83982.1 class 1b ribonucleoside-diphosphate reductase subunit alpha [Vagococcus fluvialis]
MASKTYYELNNKVNIPDKEGRIQLGKDKEAALAFFREHVNQNTVFFHTLKEKIDYLIKENYIDEEVVNQYEFDFIKGLFKSLYSKKFRFDSFMGAYKFYRQYAMMTNDGQRYLERYEDRIAFNALMMAHGDEELATSIAEEMINRRYQPATPTFLNAGRKRRGEFVSCFLVRAEDDMNAIGRTINSALQLSKIGGGVGILMTDIREAGAPIKGYEDAASGVVPVMKLYEDSFSYANQLGQRAGSGVVYLNVFHQDIETFLSTKKENADEKIRVKTLSLGLVVPDKFYELARKGEPMHLFSPYDIKKEYGVLFSQFDITERYEELVLNPRIRKKTINARTLETEISKLQQESGYPYIVNYDTVNKANPIEGVISMSNLCSEILQVQRPSVLNDDQTYEEMGTDISCNLGSLNIPNLMESEDIGKSIETSTRALTWVTDNSNIATVPTIAKGNKEARTIGLGAMGLHTYFAMNEIQYGSPESVELTDALFTVINYHSIRSSNNIAIERDTKFFNFENSDYANGKYFEMYTGGEFEFKFEKVKEIFKDIMPTVVDWKALAQSVEMYGMYHQNRLAIAPNGSISYVNETSSSLHPITQLVEKRQEGKTGKTFYPAPKLSDKTIPFYKSAYDTSMLEVIDVYAAAQKHIDQGMSLTLFMRSSIPAGLYPWKLDGGDMTTGDLTRIRHYAHEKGIKTLYYVRTHTDDGEEIGANQCESCVV